MEIFDYDNILLLPRKCRVDSRSECDAGVELGGVLGLRCGSSSWLLGAMGAGTFEVVPMFSRGTR